MPADRSDELFGQVSKALRSRSLERLQAAFSNLVHELDIYGPWDTRDTIYFGPYVDCARRLGQDPALLFGPVIDSASPDLRTKLAYFVGRSVRAVAEFGWDLEETDEGPRYRTIR